jgi:nucleoside-diphosphate-sugar epimerase
MISQALVITGASGFVGNSLANAALAYGYDVIGIDKVLIPNANFHHIQTDLCEPDLHKYIPENARVIHLAAVSTDSGAKSNPISAIEANLMATVNLIQTVNKKENTSITFASSEWVYPEKTTDSSDFEDSELRMEDLQSFYAISKLVGENLFRVVSNRRFFIYRFGIVYGPRENPGSALESIALKIARGETVEVGSGSTARRFIHINDLVDALLVDNQQFQNQNSNIYNVAGDELISLKQVAVETANIVNLPLKFVDKGESPSIRNPDSSKFKKESSWAPKHNLISGVQTCLDKLIS